MTPVNINPPPAANIQVPERLPQANAASAPMKGAKANTEPVRPAPNARCASKYSRRLRP